MIYRVTVRTTNSLQPLSTFWNADVVYCGTSLEDARVEYLRARASDYGSYGNRAKETVIEQLESEPEDIDSEESEEVEID